MEKSTTISTDSSPTTYRQITNSRLTYYRQLAICQLTDRYRYEKNCRPAVGQLSPDCWPTVGGGELFFTFTNAIQQIVEEINAQDCVIVEVYKISLRSRETLTL